MPAQISDVLRRAQTILQDVTGTRWDEPELLDWFNDGRRELAILKPAEFSERLQVPLVEGCLQQLPDGAFQLLSVACNLVNAAPRIAGRAVRFVDRRILDLTHPRWQENEVFPFSRDALNYTIDADQLTSFLVFPGNDGTGIVEVTAAVLPDEATLVTEGLGLNPLYLNAMVDYVLYRAFSKDADFTGNAERAGSHYSMFASAVGVRSTSENA